MARKAAPTAAQPPQADATVQAPPPPQEAAVPNEPAPPVGEKLEEPVKATVSSGLPNATLLELAIKRKQLLNLFLDCSSMSWDLVTLGLLQNNNYCSYLGCRFGKWRQHLAQVGGKQLLPRWFPKAPLRLWVSYLKLIPQPFLIWIFHQISRGCFYNLPRRFRARFDGNFAYAGP